jgi:hypothetical protein
MLIIQEFALRLAVFFEITVAGDRQRVEWFDMFQCDRYLLIAGTIH